MRYLLPLALPLSVPLAACTIKKSGKSQDPLSPGELGEAAAYGVDDEGMPILRAYGQGDFGRAQAATLVCAADLHLKFYEKIHGKAFAEGERDIDVYALEPHNWTPEASTVSKAHGIPFKSQLGDLNFRIEPTYGGDATLSFGAHAGSTTLSLGDGATFPHFKYDLEAVCGADANGNATTCVKTLENLRLVTDQKVYGKAVPFVNERTGVAAAYTVDLHAYAACLADEYE